MEKCCQESEKKTESGCSEKGLTNQFQAFDTVGSIASLSLAVMELQKVIGAIQGATQQLGMKLVEVMQSHNALVEKVESLANGTRPVNGADCAQNGVNTPC